MTTPTNEFEAFRHYLDDAVTQLLIEMHDQQVAYAVPADDVTELIRAVAELQGVSPWAVWEAWALRHALPVHRMVQQLSVGPTPLPHDTVVDMGSLRKRLRDLLGYCVLGLVLAEREP